MRLIVTAAFGCGLLVSSTCVEAQSFRAACKVQTLCAGVERGGGRVIACLRDHKQSLSTDCKLAIADFFLNRHGRGGAEANDDRMPGRFDRGDPGMERGAYAPSPDDRGAPPPDSMQDRMRGDDGPGARAGRYGDPGPDARDVPARRDSDDAPPEDYDPATSRR